MKKVSEISKSEVDRAVSLDKKFISVNGNNSTRQEAWPDTFNRAFDGQLTACVVTAGHPTSEELPAPVYEPTFRIGVRNVANWYKLIEGFGSNKALHVTSVADIKKAKETGRISFILGFQGANFIEEVGLIPALQRLGVRIIGLTYMNRNLIGSGCMDYHSPSGLSEYGVQVVEELNRVGIVVDLSHVHKETVMDAIKVSKNPCVFSHSAPRGLVDVFRNATDEEIKACAAKGGVICLMGLYWVLPHAPTPTIEDYLDAMEYCVKLVGIDHVGVGMDMSLRRMPGQNATLTARYPGLKDVAGGFELPPEKRFAQGLEPQTALPIIKGLVVRGYSDQDIEKIVGKNLLRVFEKTWK